MTEIEKTSLFIDCDKCLEQYMMKLDLEGKAPRFWLLDKFWRMKHLYEARPCLMKLINLARFKSSKYLWFAIFPVAISSVLLFAYNIFNKDMPIFSTILLFLSLTLSITSMLVSFVVTDYEVTSTQLVMTEDRKNLKHHFGLSSITINGKTTIY